VSTVGCFPGGCSPYGVLDLSGNVWEWTRSTYMDYPYNPKDDREDLDRKGYKVLRGGAFYSVEKSVRCSSRSSNDPRKESPNIGFRVVIII